MPDRNPHAAGRVAAEFPFVSRFPVGIGCQQDGVGGGVALADRMDADHGRAPRQLHFACPLPEERALGGADVPSRSRTTIKPDMENRLLRWKSLSVIMPRILFSPRVAGQAGTDSAHLVSDPAGLDLRVVIRQVGRLGRYLSSLQPRTTPPTSSCTSCPALVVPLFWGRSRG